MTSGGLRVSGSPHWPFGWLHYQPLGNGGNIDARYWIEPMFQDVKFNWRGEKDLKTYRVNIEDDVTDMVAAKTIASDRMA